MRKMLSLDLREKKLKAGFKTKSIKFVFQQIEMVIPLYESIRALIVETFFPRNPELGARFFEEALFLIVDDGYIEATTEDRRLQLESLISKYVL